LAALAEDGPKPLAKPAVKSAKLEGSSKQSKPQVKKVRTASLVKGKPAAAVESAKSNTPKEDTVALLKQQLAEQQKQIEMLRQALANQKELIEREIQSATASQTAGNQQPDSGVVASLTPVIPVKPKASASNTTLPSSLAVIAQPSPGAAPVTQDQMEGYTKKVDTLGKTVDALNKGLAGFKISGDVRLRSDNIFRSTNSVAGPAQNVRGRYRVRVNVDKAVTDKIDTHVQFGSGTFNNPLTLDTDMAGNLTRGAIFLTEAYGAYHPNKHFDIRGGKMTEVFADNEQFVLDDDVRFNGFQQVIKATDPKSKVNFEFRAGQYIVTNPNVQVLPTADQCASSSPPANCAYVSAGFLPGHKVPATDMFDQGVFISANNERWGHQFSADVQLWRNPNSMQLASLAAGFPVLVNGYYGLALSGGITGTGNGTTTKGGGIYTADAFHVGRASYRIDYKGWKTSRQGFPVSITAQAARNFGADFYQNALEGAINVGETKKFGDVLFKYAYYYKEANSMISQITDDDVGTGTGVNNRVHAFRIDLGLNKYMVWQNRIYVLDALASNDPARSFFVPYQRGTATQYRYQSQLQFSF
jgi:hypothetical protein